MKSTHFYFILVLALAIFFVEYDLSHRSKLVKNSKPENIQIADKKNEYLKPEIPTLPPQAENKIIKNSFIAQFKTEAEQISQIQNNPDEVQSRLKKLSLGMNAKDVQDLYEIISSEKNNGDQRALAVELLSLKNDTASLIALQNFVASNTSTNGVKWDRKKELETVLRAQAVESIAAFPQKEIAISTLDFLQSKVDQKFLSDRISRAAAGLTNKALNLQQQDDAALKKLLE